MRLGNVLSLFDGISCGQVALNSSGIGYENYYASEIDQASISITMKNYPGTIQLGDIQKLDPTVLPEIDLIMFGSPCQDFSNNGLMKGLDGNKGKLFFEAARILGYLKPKYFLMENVVMRKDWVKIISDTLGVEPIEINSKYFVPQNRARLYWSNFVITPPPTDTIPYKISDILTDDVDESYYLTEKQLSALDHNYKWRVHDIISHKGGKHQQDTIYRHDGIICCLAASHHGAARHLTKTYLDNGKIRRLTEIEVERLQGLPYDYTAGVSSSKRYEAIGNGWTVPVISYIFDHIKKEY